MPAWTRNTCLVSLYLGLLVGLLACGRTGEDIDAFGPVDVRGDAAFFDDIEIPPDPSALLVVTPDELVFDDGAATVGGGPARITVENVGDAPGSVQEVSYEGSSFFGLGPEVLDLPVTLQTGQEWQLSVARLDLQPNIDGGYIRLLTQVGDALLPQYVPVYVRPPVCPEYRVRCGDGVRTSTTGVLRTEPLRRVECLVEGLDGWALGWQLVQRAPASSERLNVAADGRAFSLAIDTSGDYLVELDMERGDGARPCLPQLIRLLAAPTSDLHVELTWSRSPTQVSTRGGGMDLDLHFLWRDRGGWGSTPWDVHFRNMTPADWGSTNPTLDRDDTSGFGPENLNIMFPVQGERYRVGVHGYSVRGTVYANLRIYVRGQLRVSAQSPPMDATGQFWEAVEILWDDWSPTFQAVDQMYRNMCASPLASGDCIRR